MARKQINVRLPEDLLTAARKAPESMTELVEDGLRLRLSIPANGFKPGGVVEAPSREEFDEIAAIVRRLHRLAENSGAL
jgi:hypothetical protein